MSTHLISSGFHLDSQICEEKWLNLQSKKLCRLVSKDNRILPNREFAKELQNNSFSLSMPQQKSQFPKLTASDLYDYKSREKSISSCYNSYYKIYKNKFDNQNPQEEDGKIFYQISFNIKLCLDARKNKMQNQQQQQQVKEENDNLPMFQIKYEDDETQSKIQKETTQKDQNWQRVDIEEIQWVDKVMQDIKKDIDCKTRRYQTTLQNMQSQSHRKKIINEKTCPIITLIFQQNQQQAQRVQPVSVVQQAGRPIQKMTYYPRQASSDLQQMKQPEQMHLQHQISQSGSNTQPMSYNIPGMDQTMMATTQPPPQAMMHPKLMQQKFPAQIQKQQQMMINHQQRQQGMPMQMSQQQIMGNQQINSQLYYQNVQQFQQKPEQPQHYQQNVIMQQQQQQQQMIQPQMMQQPTQANAQTGGRTQANMQNSYIMNGINHGINNRTTQSNRSGSNKKGETKKRKKDKD